jgi:hypothetical protein
MGHGAGTYRPRRRPPIRRGAALTSSLAC